jgi:hypothetical protein
LIIDDLTPAGVVAVSRSHDTGRSVILIQLFL